MYFREQERFDQEQEIRRQKELEDLREEDETPNEDSESKPKHLPLVEDQAQELVSVNVTTCSQPRTALSKARFFHYNQAQLLQSLDAKTNKTSVTFSVFCCTLLAV